MWIIYLCRSFCSRPYCWQSFLVGASMQVFVKRNAIVVCSMNFMEQFIRWVSATEDSQQGVTMRERGRVRGKKTNQQRNGNVHVLQTVCRCWAPFVFRFHLQTAAKWRGKKESKHTIIEPFIVCTRFFVHVSFYPLSASLGFVAWKKLAHERKWSWDWAGCG